MSTSRARNALPAVVGVGAAVLAVVAVVAASRGRSTAAAPPVPVVGIAPSAGSVLRHYDPLTLRRVGSAEARLRVGVSTWIAAPGGGMLAIGGEVAGEVDVVDPRSLRVRSSTTLPGRGIVAALGWLGTHRLAALTTGPRCCGATATGLAVLSEPDGHLLWRRHFASGLVAAQSAGGRLVFLLVPRRRLGPPRLSTVSARGGGSLTLDGLVSGFRRAAGAVRLQLRPGLALDHGGRHAYIVSGTGAVAVVDLTAMTAHIRRVGVERFRGRTLPASVPAHAALSMSPPGVVRRAVLAGPHTLAVWGDDATARRTAGHWRSFGHPSGLTILDTRTWRARRLDRTSDDAVALGGVVVASGSGGPPPGYGLTGYDAAGRRRFRLLPGEQATIAGCDPPRGLVYAVIETGQPRLAVVDARRGRVLRYLMTRWPLPLAAPARAFAFF